MDVIRLYCGALRLFLEFGYVVLFFGFASTTCIVCVLRSLADYYCFFELAESLNKPSDFGL